MILIYWIFLAMIIVASLLPDSFLWGVHFLAFTPLPFKLGIVLLSIACASPLVSHRYVPILAKIIPPVDSLKKRHLLILIGIGGIAGIIFYVAHMAIDIYGDSRYLMTLLTKQKFPLWEVLNFNDTEPLTRFIHQQLSNITNIDQHTVYQICSSVVGALYVISYGWFVITLRGSSLWKLFLLILGLGCGANQLFFGYVEDYTLVYFCMIIFLILAWQFFDGKRTLPWMIVVFLIGAKLHVQMTLLGPALCYAILYSAARRRPGLQRWTSPTGVLSGIALSLVLAVILYFFVFKANRFDTGDDGERVRKIFLPLVNYLHEPHSYTLLSPAHLSDVLQELLLVVAPGVFVVGALSLIRFSSLKWSTPRMIFLLLCTLYPILFDLTVDPIMTPMRDWDMMSLVCAPLLFLGAALSQQWFEKGGSTTHTTKLVGVALGLALIPMTFFYINSDQVMASARMRSLGIWAFNSYYNGSGYIVNNGFLPVQDRKQEIAERERIVNQLEPNASGQDFELGYLYFRLAGALQKNKEYDSAEYYIDKSIARDSSDAAVIKEASVISLLQGKFDKAARTIEWYNENINMNEAKDFQALVIAQYAHRCLYLVQQRAEQSAIEKILKEVERLPSQ